MLSLTDLPDTESKSSPLSLAQLPDTPKVWKAPKSVVETPDTTDMSDEELQARFPHRDTTPYNDHERPGQLGNFADTLSSELEAGAEKGISFGLSQQDKDRAREWVGEDTYDNMGEVNQSLVNFAHGNTMSKRMRGETSIQEDLIFDTAITAGITGVVSMFATPAAGVPVGQAAGKAMTALNGALRSGYLFFTRGTVAAVLDAPINLNAEVLFRQGETGAGLITSLGGGAGMVSLENVVEKATDGTLQRIAPDFFMQQIASPDIAKAATVTRLTELAKRADEGDAVAIQEMADIIIETRKLSKSVNPTVPEVDKMDVGAPPVKDGADVDSPVREQVKPLNRTQLWEAAKKESEGLDPQSVKKTDDYIEQLAVAEAEVDFLKSRKAYVKEFVEEERAAEPAFQVATRIIEDGGFTPAILKTIGVSADEIKTLRKKFPKMFAKIKEGKEPLNQFGRLVSLSNELGFGPDIRRMFQFTALSADTKTLTDFVETMLKKDFEGLYSEILSIKKARLTREVYGLQEEAADLTGMTKFSRISTRSEMAALNDAVKMARKTFLKDKKQAMDALAAMKKQMKKMSAENRAKHMDKHNARIKKIHEKYAEKKVEQHLKQVARNSAKKMENRIRRGIKNRSGSNEWSEQLGAAMERWFPKEAKAVLEGPPAQSMEEFLMANMNASPLGSGVTDFMSRPVYSQFRHLLDGGTPLVDMTESQWKIIDTFVKEFNELSKRESIVLGAVKKIHIAQIADEVAMNANKNVTWLSKIGNKEKNTTVEKIGKLILSNTANLKLIRYIAKDLDNMQDGGVLFRNIVQPAEQAQREMIELATKYHPRIESFYEKAAGKGAKARKHFSQEVTFKIAGGELTWTRERIFMAGLNSGNPYNRAALLNTIQKDLVRADTEITGKLADHIVEDITKLLTKGEKEAIDDFWKLTGEMGDSLDEVHRTLTGKTLKREKNFFPLKKKYDPLTDSAPTKAEIMERSQYSSTWQTKGGGMRKERTGGIQELDLSLGVISRHMDDAMLQITHAVPLNNISKIINNKTFKKAVFETRGEAWYRQFDAWMVNLTRTHPEKANSTMLALRKSVSVAMLGVFNVGVIFKQPLSAIAAARDIGGGSATKGLGYLLKANAVFLRNPKAFLARMRSVDPMMADRATSMSREMVELAARNNPMTGKMKVATYNLQQAMMVGIRIGDNVGTGTTWMATFDRVMAETGDIVKAHAEATEVVARTQPSGAAMELSSFLSSKNEFLRAFGMFSGYFSRLHNMTSEVMRRLPPPTGPRAEHQLSKSEVFSALFTMIVLPTIVGHTIVKGEIPDAGEIVGSSASLATGGIPFARDVVNAATQGYGYSPSPLVEPPMETVRILNQLHKIVLADDEMDPEKLAKSSAMVVGYTLGVPVKSAIDRVTGMLELMSGDGSLHDAVFGKAKDE